MNMLEIVLTHLRTVLGYINLLDNFVLAGICFLVFLSFSTALVLLFVCNHLHTSVSVLDPADLLLHDCEVAVKCEQCSHVDYYKV